MSSRVLKWLESDVPAIDYYQLLGRPCFDPRRDALLDEIRKAQRQLLPYQNHRDPETAQRATDLLYELARAEDTLSNRDKLNAHHEAILQRLKDQLAALDDRHAAKWDKAGLRKWLQEAQHVHQDCLEQVCDFIASREANTGVIALDETFPEAVPLVSSGAIREAGEPILAEVVGWSSDPHAAAPSKSVPLVDIAVSVVGALDRAIGKLLGPDNKILHNFVRCSLVVVAVAALGLPVVWLFVVVTSRLTVAERGRPKVPVQRNRETPVDAARQATQSDWQVLKPTPPSEPEPTLGRPIEGPRREPTGGFRVGRSAERAAPAGLRQQFGDHVSPVEILAWSPDNRHLASADYENQVKLWDAETGAGLPGPGPQAEDVDRLLWSPDGQHLAMVFSSGTIAIWDRVSGRTMALRGGKVGYVDLSWDPTGQHLATAQGGVVSVFQWVPGGSGWKALEQARWIADAAAAAWSPNGRKLAYSGRAADSRACKVFVFDLLDRERFELSPSTPDVRARALWWRPAPDRGSAAAGVLMLAARLDRSVDFWKVPRTGRPTPRATLRVQWNLDICPHGLARRGQAFAMAEGGRVIVCQYLSHSRAFRILPWDNRYDSAVSSVNWANADSRIAASRNDGTIAIWDGARPGTPTLFKAAEAALCVKWRSDDQVLASGHRDGKIRLWAPGPSGSQRALPSAQFERTNAAPDPGSDANRTGPR